MLRRSSMILLAGLALAGAPAAAQAQEAPAGDAAFRATTLSLQAEGQARLAPDMATISLGVSTEAPRAAQAQQQNAARMATVLRALHGAGIAGRDVQTATLSLAPQYAYAEGQPPRLTGYRAANAVSVAVRDLQRLAAVIDGVAQAGADEVGGVSFGLSDPRAAEDAARRDAVARLQGAAALYARAAGLQVGRLVNLTETGGYSPPTPRPMMAMRAMKVEATPIESGEIDVRVQTRATYELTR